jgi:hypothetical protein
VPDRNTMQVVRDILEPLFLAHDPPINYKRQRNAGFARDVPAAIVSRAGGFPMRSFQGKVVKDAPILVIDVWTKDEDLTEQLASWVEDTLIGLGATQLTGQVAVPAAVEREDLRGVSVSFQLIINLS